MYDYREYFIAIAAIFLALALGILIGVSFGDNFLVSNQREIIELMELELGRRKSLIEKKDVVLDRWEQVKPLVLRGYRDSLLDKSIIVISDDEQRAAEMIILMEMTGAEVQYDTVDQLLIFLQAAKEDLTPDCYILLMDEEDPAYPDSAFSELWQLLHQNEQRVIAAFPWFDSEVPVIPADHKELSIVDNIDTFWGQVALLEMVVYGAHGDYGFSAQRQGLLPLPADSP